MSNEIQRQTSKAKYFSSPKEAVPVITELLLKQDYKTLSCYYDLSASGVTMTDLESGDFFARKNQPEAAHPAAFWRYKHPFSPGFTYSGMNPGPAENVYRIRVETQIDQGENSPSQIGYSMYYMIKSSKGWQLLPDPVKEEDPLELPSTAPDIMPDL